MSKSRLSNTAPRKLLAAKKNGDVPACLLDPEKCCQRVAVGEEEGVVQERLADEQREAQHGPPRIERKHRARDERHTDRSPLPYGDLPRRLGQVAILGAYLLLDLCNNAVAFTFSTVDEQPAWALRHIAADQQHGYGKDGTKTERQPPTNRGIDERRVQQRDGEQCTADGAYPERAVDHNVHSPPVVRGDQLVDRGVDGRVLTADPRTSQEPACDLPCRIGCKRREYCRDCVDT